MERPTRSVPCGTCTLCCKGEAIVLHPEDGDDVDSYETEVIEHPLKPGKRVHILKRRGDSCFYLGPFGCSIHARRPVICREFDCREFYKTISHHKFKKLQKAGVVTKTVWTRGRELLALTEEKNDP